jgi:ankyrin repeat protein
MNIANVYKQLIGMINTNTPSRQEQKSKFIETRMKQLSQQSNVTLSEKQSQIQNYINYSEHGVMSTLFRSKDYPNELKSIALSELTNHPKSDMSELNFGSNVMVAQYFTDGHPNMAMIYNNQSGPTTAKIVTFSDFDELNQSLQESAINESFKLYNDKKIDGQELVSSIKSLSYNNNEFLTNITQHLNYDISSIAEDLKLTVNLENELDKSLKNQFSDKKVQSAIIEQLRRDGTLEDYQKARINNYSVLSDDAQQRLMVLVERQLDSRPTIDNQPSPVNIQNDLNEGVDNQTLFNNNSSLDSNVIKEENEISSADKSFRPDLKQIREDYDTLFRKIVVGEGENQQHYYETVDKSVKIHEQKVSVSKITQDSVGLAIKAAVQTYGNDLELKGTREFKDIALKILSQEIYKDVQLNNPELQDKLNQMRGIVPVENSITPAQIINENVENKQISSSGIDTPNDSLDTTPKIESIDNNVVEHQLNSTNELNSDTKDINVEEAVSIIENVPTELNHPVQVNLEDDLILEQSEQIIDVSSTKIDINLFEILDSRYYTPSPLEDFANQIKQCDNLNQVNENGETPLIEAISAGMVNEAQELIKAGADIHHVTKDGYSAFDYAVNMEHSMLDMCTSLIRAGSAVENNTEKFTPLMRVLSGHDLVIDEPGISLEERSEVCKLLINNGANLDAVDKKGKSVLMYAVGNGDDKLVDLIASKVSDINLRDQDGRTALHYVDPRLSYSLNVADALIKNNADVNVLDSDNNTPKIVDTIRIAQHFEQEQQSPLKTMSL